jgi:hypothetical protein
MVSGVGLTAVSFFAGVPALIVTISAAIYPDGYGTYT